MENSAPAARPRLVSAFDTFRASASASELSDAVARAARARGVDVDTIAMSDGGEGFVDAFDGDDVTESVAGPRGEAVTARIRLRDTESGLVAVAQVADAVGRTMLQAPTREEALAASSEGVGQLILAAARLGAFRVLLGCGDSATSDAGLGCYRVLRAAGGLPVDVVAATDVTARFLEARRYASQKGVADEDLALVDARLRAARDLYHRECDVDVQAIPRTGAAGGIPGALAALGARLVDGVEEVSRSVRLVERLETASLVVSGEGRLDAGSLEGKVVAGVAARTPPSTPLLVVCGSVEADAAREFIARYPNATLVSLVERFGEERARSETARCVAQVVGAALDDTPIHQF